MNERMDGWMDGVVLIRCLDEWLVFYCPFAVVFIPVRVRDLSYFFDRFSHRVLGRSLVDFGDQLGPQNRQKIMFLLKKRCPGAVF